MPQFSNKLIHRINQVIHSFVYNLTVFFQKLLKKNSFYQFLLIMGMTVLLSLPFSVQALTLSPAIHEAVIKQNEHEQVSLALTNDSDDAVVTTFSVLPFSSVDNSGTPHITHESTYAQWVVGLPDHLEMLPHERKNLQVSIAPPQGSVFGGHYFAVFATTVPKQQDTTSVKATTSVGGLFFITIPDSEQKIHLTASMFRPVSTISLSIPQSFTFFLKNDSASHLIPQGEVRIAALRGSHIYAIPLVTDKRVLPKQMRTFTITWNPEGLWWSPLNPFRFGVYDVDLVLSNAPVDGTLRTRFILLSPSGILILIVTVACILWHYSRQSKK